MAGCLITPRSRTRSSWAPSASTYCPPRTRVPAPCLAARLQADLARYATTVEMIVLPAVNPQHIPLTSFTHARDLIAQALTAARTVLAAHDAHPAWARAS